MGESASITELEPFGRSMDDKREVFDEAVQAIFPMFKDGASEHHGKYFDMPLRHVLPKPMQKPHPPIWMACSQLDTIARAGRLRHGRAGLPVRQRRRGARLGARLLQRHHQAPEASSPTTRITPTSRSSASSCAPRPTRRRASGPTAATFFQFALRFYGASGRPQAPGARHGQHVGRVQRLEARQPGRPGGGAARRPDRLARHACARSSRKFETSHIDQVILLNQAGKNTHEHICKSLSCSPSEVMPEFQGHHAAHEAWKAQVMAGEIELEEIETAAFQDRYGTKSMPVQAIEKAAVRR